MWPWIRHWRDWARTDLWPLSRPGVQGQAMHHSYEKGGLVIDDQPIRVGCHRIINEMGHGYHIESGSGRRFIVGRDTHIVGRLINSFLDHRPERVRRLTMCDHVELEVRA